MEVLERFKNCRTYAASDFISIDSRRFAVYKGVGLTTVTSDR